MVIGSFLNVLRMSEENLYFSIRNSAVCRETFLRVIRFSGPNALAW